MLRPSKQRQVALTLVQNVASAGVTVSSAAHMEMLGAYLQPLIVAGEADADVVFLEPPALPTFLVLCMPALGKHASFRLSLPITLDICVCAYPAFHHE